MPPPRRRPLSELPPAQFGIWRYPVLRNSDIATLRLSPRAASARPRAPSWIPTFRTRAPPPCSMAPFLPRMSRPRRVRAIRLRTRRQRRAERSAARSGTRPTVRWWTRSTREPSSTLTGRRDPPSARSTSGAAAPGLPLRPLARPFTRRREPPLISLPHVKFGARPRGCAPAPIPSSVRGAHAHARRSSLPGRLVYTVAVERPYVWVVDPNVDTTRFMVLAPHSQEEEVASRTSA